MKQLITPNDLESVNNMLYELTCLRRWSEVTVEGGKYTELAKQALNCMIAYILATEVQNAGYSVDFTLFPKIAIVRGFTKDYQCDVPEQNLEKIFQLGKVSRESFAEMIQQEIKAITSEDFYEFLQVDANSLEVRIYKAATKIATLQELGEIKNGINATDYSRKKAHLQDNLMEFSDLPGFSKVIEYTEIFRDFSLLRNRIRWAKHPNIIKCSVLGHHFDVGVLAYLMSLEKDPSDEVLATRFFFMGIFHDFPERWTGDMPSPVKNALEGLRAATELFENQVMEENVYRILPPYQVEAIRKVMLEDEENEAFKSFLKKSDNYAAFIECWREIDAGSNHNYYFDVVVRDYSHKEKYSENFQKLMDKLFYDIAYHR